MFKRRTLGFLLSFLLIYTAVFGSMPVQFAKAETDTAPAIANVVGDFQSKIGDSDWNINSDKTVMTYKGNGFMNLLPQLRYLQVIMSIKLLLIIHGKVEEFLHKVI